MKMPVYPSDVVAARCSGCQYIPYLLAPLPGVCCTPHPEPCMDCYRFHALKRTKLWLAWVCEMRMHAPASDALHRPTARSLRVFGYPRYIDVADD